jgi:hypothetical protein
MSIIKMGLKSTITQIAEEDTAARKRRGQIAVNTQTSRHMAADAVADHQHLSSGATSVPLPSEGRGQGFESLRARQISST